MNLGVCAVLIRFFVNISTVREMKGKNSESVNSAHHFRLCGRAGPVVIKFTMKETAPKPEGTFLQ